MPPVSSGGTALLQMLNMLEGYDLAGERLRLARATVHLRRRGHAPRLRRPRALPGRSRRSTRRSPRRQRLISKEYAAALRRTIRRGPGLALVAALVRVAGRERRDHAPLGGGRGRATRSRSPTRSRTATARDRGARRRLPAQQRDGRLQRGPRPHRRRGPDRHRAQPGRARQAHALEHDADHPGEGRPARSWPSGSPGRAHDHQHRAADDPRTSWTSA